MRLAALLALSALLVAGCGGSSADSKQEHPSFAGVDARTKAAGPARFRMLIGINAGGTRITAEENGTTSFAQPPRAPLQAAARAASSRRSSW